MASGIAVPRETLNFIPAPDQTDTWKPIAHGRLLDAMELGLGAPVTQHKLFVNKSGLKSWGVLTFGDIAGGIAHRTVGFKHSNDKSHGIRLYIGAEIKVCSNGMVLGNKSQFFAHKHTTGLRLDDVTDAVSRAVSTIDTDFEFVRERLVNRRVEDTEFNERTVDIFARKRLLPMGMMPDMVAAYREPESRPAWGAEKNLWNEYNSYTYAVNKQDESHRVNLLNRVAAIFENVRK